MGWARWRRAGLRRRSIGAEPASGESPGACDRAADGRAANRARTTRRRNGPAPSAGPSGKRRSTPWDTSAAPKRFESLVNFLHSPDDRLSIGAAQALAMMGPEAKLAIPDLVAELSNPSVDVRKNVIRALGQMGASASAAIRPLTEDILRPESKKDQEILGARAPKVKAVPAGVPQPPTSSPGSH